ncbi:MAG: acyltransferase [Candidatus Accumulibacter sp.]|uniref:acyltransferase family protein n=1 Tax=Accumulibacter sp. TaxID=2053492 RepID=UPI0025E2D71E|nr:acyltransferase family protein [Accumulibacter sp.]MCP5247116.1 acyltransferase [Accumulibacter sp.]
MHHPSDPTPAKYRPDIDGLRAVAIISVAFYHARFPGFSGGFVGVDVFFVISGFLITALLFNEAAATGRLGLAAFYARRVRRLMPAGLIVLAVTILLAAFFMPPASDEQRSLARSAMAVAFFSSNIFFYATTGGYFDAPSFSMPLLHTWSLAVEEQYYLIWPLLMLLVVRFSRQSPVADSLRVRVVLALCVMFVLSLALSIGMSQDHQNFAFYLLPARVWEFAIGGMVGLVGTGFLARLTRWGEALAMLGLGLIVYSVAAFDDSTPFPGSAAILPVFGAALLIVGMTANEQGIVRRLLASRPLVSIGLLSYSWYLWHWPLLSLYRIYNLGSQSLLANALALSVALVLAWLTYVWIERPVRMRRTFLFGGVRTTLLAGGAISLATLLMSAGLWAWRDHQKSADSYRWIEMARADRPRFLAACSRPERPVAGLPLEECGHGPDKKHPKILLWGDSHAQHLLPMLTEVFSDVAVYELTMPTCVPFFDLESPPSTTSSACIAFNQRVLEEILELKEIGLEGVVIAARWPLHFSYRSFSTADQADGEPPPDATTMAQVRADMQASLAATLGALEDLGLRVLVIAPTPQLVYSAPQCLALREKDHCHAPRALNDALLADTTEALAEVVAQQRNARLIRLLDFFCDAQTCYASRDGKILYHDDDHLTTTAARDLGRYLAADLAWLRRESDAPGASAGSQRGFSSADRR